MKILNLPDNISPTLIDNYDALACDVVSDETEHLISGGARMSLRRMSSNVCDLMGWDDFDLFGPIDFDGVYARERQDEVLAHLFLAYLRFVTFRRAAEENVGPKMANDIMIAHSESWYRKLSDLWVAIRTGKDAVHRWQN